MWSENASALTGKRWIYCKAMEAEFKKLVPVLVMGAQHPLQGTPLFKGLDGVGFLKPADPVLLMWDIEQAYPTLQ